jgi:hypothetical protein
MDKHSLPEVGVVLQKDAGVFVRQNSESWEDVKFLVHGLSGRINGLSLSRALLRFPCKKLLE